MKQGYLILAAAGFVLASGGSALAHSHDMKGHGHEHGSSMFDRLDTNQDGNVDRAEMEAGAADHFSRMDADGDGAVTQAEMKAFHKKNARGAHEKARE